MQIGRLTQISPEISPKNWIESVSLYHKQPRARAVTHPAAINDDDSTRVVFTPSKAASQGFREVRTMTRVTFKHNRTLCCVKPDKVLRTVWLNPLNHAYATACPRLYLRCLLRARHGRGRPRGVYAPLPQRVGLTRVTTTRTGRLSAANPSRSPS